MFHPDFHFGAPTGNQLLAEIGIRPDTVREVVEDERAIRCPDRGAVFPAWRFADTQNAHAQYDGLIGALTPALGQQGLERLKQRMIELSDTPLAQLPEARRPRPPWPFAGMADEDETADRMRLRTARAALKDIADAQGDVDAFIDQHDDDARKRPKVATGIARTALRAHVHDRAINRVSPPILERFTEQREAGGIPEATRHPVPPSDGFRDTSTPPAAGSESPACQKRSLGRESESSALR